MSSQSSTPRPRSSPHPRQPPHLSPKLTARQQDAQARNKDPFEEPDEPQWEGNGAWSKYDAYVTVSIILILTICVYVGSHAKAAAAASLEKCSKGGGCNTGQS